MRVVDQSDVATSLLSLLGDLGQETVAIQSNGRNIAFVVSPEQYATIRKERSKRLLVAMDRLSSKIAERAAADGLDLNDLMRSLDRKAS